MTMIEGHIVPKVPDGVPVWDVDPYDPAILSDPQAYYADLRAKGPFAYIPRYGVLACGRYAETKEVFGDHTRFVSSRGVGLLDFCARSPFQVFERGNHVVAGFRGKPGSHLIHHVD